MLKWYTRMTTLQKAFYWGNIAFQLLLLWLAIGFLQGDFNTAIAIVLFMWGNNLHRDLSRAIRKED